MKNSEQEGVAGLPNRWCRKHGAIYYRVPDRLVRFWGKRWYRLGATYKEAVEAYYAKLDEISGSADRNIEIESADKIESRGVAVKGPVVYFLISEGRIVYVGQSISVASRIASHSDKKFDRVATIPCDESDLDILEAAYISRFRPPYNTRLSNEKALEHYFG